MAAALSNGVCVMGYDNGLIRPPSLFSLSPSGVLTFLKNKVSPASFQIKKNFFMHPELSGRGVLCRVFLIEHNGNV